MHGLLSGAVNRGLLLRVIFCLLFVGFLNPKQVRWIPVRLQVEAFCDQCAKSVSEWSLNGDTALELRESRGGRAGLSVPNIPYGLCGRTAALNLERLLWPGAVSKSRWTSWAPRP